MPQLDKEIRSKFSPSALKTFETASTMAGEMGASLVSTEQVILALSRSSLKPVFQALKIDEDYFRSVMPQPDKAPFTGVIRFSREVDELAYRAIDSAARHSPGKVEDFHILEAVLDSPMVIEAYLIRRSIKPGGSMMRASLADCLWNAARHFQKHPDKFRNTSQKAA